MTTFSKKYVQKNRPPKHFSVFHGNKFMDRRKKAVAAVKFMKAWIEKNEPEMVHCFDNQTEDMVPLRN